MNRLLIVLALARLAFPNVAAAQPPSVLATPAWLTAHLHDPNLVILQVGMKADYDKAHVPGARFVAPGDFATNVGNLHMELPPADAFRSRLEALGVSDDSVIVVTFSPAQSGGPRLFVTLEAYGLKAAVLDGGAAAWAAAGGSMTDTVPEVHPGTLKPLQREPLIVDADFVTAHEKTPGFAIVDARGGAFASGEGHIPGAIHLPSSDFASANGNLKSAAELRQLFAHAGIKPHDTVIAYCEVGAVASATVLAARAIGQPVVLYDGSMEDWRARKLPVEQVPPVERAPVFFEMPAAELASHVHDPALVLLQFGEQSDYDAGHIPGAQRIAFEDFAVTTPAGSVEMPDPETFRHRLESLGVSDSSIVVVYWGGTRPLIFPASRLLLTLNAFGFAHAAILAGGQQEWVANGGTLTKDVPASRQGKLSPLSVKPLVVDANFVAAHEHTPAFVLVDSRPVGMFDGMAMGKEKGGHIPGAKSIPANDLVTADLQIKPVADLQAIFTKAGVKPGDTVVAYCSVGLVASTTALVARALGHPVLLYDGSMEDWSRRDLPVEKTPGKNPQ